MTANPGIGDRSPRAIWPRIDRPVLEGGDDPEVAAAAAQRPEQLGVAVRPATTRSPVGRHDLGPDQVVAGEALGARQPADPAAQRQPADAGVAERPADDRQVMRPGRDVDVLPEGAALGSDDARRRDRR